MDVFELNFPMNFLFSSIEVKTDNIVIENKAGYLRNFYFYTFHLICDLCVCGILCSFFFGLSSALRSNDQFQAPLIIVFKPP